MRDPKADARHFILCVNGESQSIFECQGYWLALELGGDSGLREKAI